MIRWEIDGDVGVITIDRSERRNALDRDHCDALAERLDDLGEVRAVVLRGEGSAFCSGADLTTRFAASTETEANDSFRPTFERLLDRFEEVPVPFVAAINGAALGAGMQLATVCDLRVAGPRARIGVPAAKLGFSLGLSFVERLVALVGPGNARDLLLTGRLVDAADAHTMGLVQRVAEDAFITALGVAREIAALAPLAHAAHKAMILASTARRGRDDDAIVAEAARLEAATFASADRAEGVAAFAEKRAPRFLGH